MKKMLLSIMRNVFDDVVDRYAAMASSCVWSFVVGCLMVVFMIFFVFCAFVFFGVGVSLYLNCVFDSVFLGFVVVGVGYLFVSVLVFCVVSVMLSW